MLLASYFSRFPPGSILEFKKFTTTVLLQHNFCFVSRTSTHAIRGGQSVSLSESNSHQHRESIRGCQSVSKPKDEARQQQHRDASRGRQSFSTPKDKAYQQQHRDESRGGQSLFTPRSNSQHSQQQSVSSREGNSQQHRNVRRDGVVESVFKSQIRSQHFVQFRGGPSADKKSWLNIQLFKASWSCEYFFDFFSVCDIQWKLFVKCFLSHSCRFLYLHYYQRKLFVCSKLHLIVCFQSIIDNAYCANQEIFSNLQWQKKHVKTGTHIGTVEGTTEVYRCHLVSGLLTCLGCWRVLMQWFA